MAAMILIRKEDALIQYIDKVVAKRSANLKELEESKLGLHHRRTRRDIKADVCKGLQITSAVTAGAANIASAATSAASSMSFIGAPGAAAGSLAAAAGYLAQTTADVAYISMDCDSIPFDEIKEIMDKRFNNLDKAIDRNYALLQEVSKLVSKTLTAVEQTRIEMHQGFNHVLLSIKNSRIELVLSRLNNYIRYFDIEKDHIKSLSKENYINQIDETTNVLNYLKDSRIPKEDSLDTLVNEIINRKFSIPSGPDDIIAISALYALHYGTQTYISVLFFLIEQHSYIADYYYQNGDLKKFNEHFGKIQDVFQKFRSTLVGGKALIDNVVNIIKEVQGTDFIADDRALTESLAEKLEELEKIKHQIFEMELPVVMETPGKFTGKISFESSSIRTPFGEWINGKRVYYAMQYKDGDKYSKVGPWSEPLIVYGKANPILKFPVDVKRRTRLIYRKFNNNKPELVGTVEGKYQTEYRDIHRDLYNAGNKWINEKAEKVIETLLQHGANSSEIFEHGRSALHSAAEGGNSNIAIKTLKPADINIRDDNGYTALHIAAEAGHDDLVRALLENGADINVQTFAEEITPLHLAARKGYEYTVRLLMNHQGIDMNLGDNEGFTPLHNAVAGGLPVMEAILTNSNVNINGKSDRGIAALHLAVMNNYLDAVEVLLRHGNLDINIRTEESKTPLHLATILGHFDMVQFLLNNGADINVKDVINWTPLHYAISLKNQDIALLFLNSRNIELNPKSNDDFTPMHIACGSSQVQIVQKILENKSSDMVQQILSTKTKDGLTPLHIAVMNKHKNIVTILFEKDADIEAKTNQGLTPLLAAAASGNLDIVKYLVRNNADINAVDVNDNSVLNLAAEGGHLDVVKYFAQYKNLDYKTGPSLLNTAISKGHLKIVQYLVDDKRVDHTCDLAVPNCALSVACKYGNVDIVKYLVSKHNSIDLSGPPLQNAAQYGHLGLVKYIIEEKRADPNHYENGKTPMLLASKYGWLSIVKYLHEKHNIALDVGRNHYKQSNIQLAITSGNLYLVKYLMETNVVTNGLEDPEYNKSPLHFAIHDVNFKGLNDKQSSSVLRYLVDEKNYNVNAQEKYGYTPLHRAVDYESFYAIKFLIARGADIHIKSTSHETPLDLATKYKKSVELQQFLQMQDVCNTIWYKKVPQINQGYNVNVKCVHINKKLMDDIYHTTALHLAVETGAIDTVKLLISHGANVNARDEEGNVPLHYAVQNVNVELINTLIQNEADVTLKNLNNQTPRDLAKENQATQISEILKKAQSDHNRGTMTKAKRSINQEPALGTESSSKPHDNVLAYIIEEGCGNSGTTPLCLSSSSDNQDSIDVRGAQCLDSNVSLGLLLAQNFLNKKFPLPKFPHVTPAEARAMALTISKNFEKLLKKYVKNDVEFDFYQLYVDIEANINNEKFSNVPNVLLEFAKNVCGKDVDTVSGKIANIFRKF